jgi:hypothetical protein
MSRNMGIGQTQLDKGDAEVRVLMLCDSLY